MGRSDLELYVRGKNLGIIDLETGKKHRLNTLDPELMPAFEARLLKVEVEPEERKPEETRERAKTSERRHEAEERKQAGAGQNEKTPNTREKASEQASKAATPEPELSPEQKAWREQIDQQRGQSRETGPERDRD